MYEILKNGHFVKQDIAYKSLMKRHIKKTYFISSTYI